MAASMPLDVQVAVQSEQIKTLTARVDLLIKLAFSILVAVVGAGITFVFVILSQLGHG